MKKGGICEFGLKEKGLSFERTRKSKYSSFGYLFMTLKVNQCRYNQLAFDIFSDTKITFT